MKKIGVVGAGLVGSVFQTQADFEVVHHYEWKDAISDWRGIVNCAAIAGSGLCDEVSYDEVIQANVEMPMEMQAIAYDLGVPFLTLSAASVYRCPKNTKDRLQEDAPTFPHNLYCASKILMETSLLKDGCFIFRIPQVDLGTDHPNDFGQKVKGWHVAEDVHQSLLYPETLIESVRNAMNARTRFHGIYNVATEDVHMPTYIREKYGWAGKVVPAYSLGLSPALRINSAKAQGLGIIGERDWGLI